MADALLCRPLPFTISEVGNQTTAGPATNLLNDRLGRSWKCAGAGNCYIVIDLGAAMTIDTVALLATNVASGGEFLQIRASNTLAHLTSSGPSGPFLVNTGNAVPIPASSIGYQRLHRNAFAKITATTARYWRFDVATSDPAFSAGRLVVGQAFQAADGVDFGWSFEVVDNGSAEETALGIEDIKIAGKVLAYKWTWSWLTQSEARGALLDLMAYAGNTRPVLLCFDYEASDLHNTIAFGRMVDGLRQENYVTGLFEATFTMKSKLILGL